VELDRYADTAFGRPGRTPGQHGYVAYLPRPIPRALDLDGAVVRQLADAESALGRLAGAGRLLPYPHVLVGPYLRREAVSSARIEGTQASLIDVFEAEADERPLDADLEEVVNYLQAMAAGLARLATLPLSVRLIREMHAVVLDGVRGRDRQPGELRTSQNWIGRPGATLEEAAFVPPPPEVMGPLLDDWERFVHDGSDLPPLVEAALLHYQFETIHPFLDGNGRLGRLLIVFFLVLRDRLPHPLLYLSPYFEARRDEYYDRLQGVRERGDIAGWLGFFLRGIDVQATDALHRAERLTDLREDYRARVQEAYRSKAIVLLDLAFEQPILTTRLVERRLEVTRPSSLRLLRQLEELEILVEAPAGLRGQHRWRAPAILDGLASDMPA
jgi:Fic family protein